MAGRRERILLVENDPDISDLIARRALEPLGYAVKVVIQASDAIEAALQNPFDLIIADLTLPDLEGTDLLAALSSQGVRAPLVVIVLKGEERHAIQAFRLGAVDAILWPANDAEIVRVLERAIQPTRARRMRQELQHELEAVRNDLERRSLDLNTILQLSRAATSGMRKDEFFGKLLEDAARMAQADMAWLTVRDEKTGKYILEAHRNLPANWASKLGRPLDDGLNTLVVQSGQALLIHGKPLEAFKISGLARAAAIVPAKARHRVQAILMLARTSDVEMERELKPLLETLAGFLAIFLVNQSPSTAIAQESATTGLGDDIRRALMDSLQSPLQRLRSLRAGELGDLSPKHKDLLAEIEASLDQSAGLLGRVLSGNK